MNTPVLLITFNRPEHTRKVLEAIMAAQPKDLYVFQDGAREGNEKDLVNCPKVREVVQSLVGGTETQLHTFYSERNLGCGPGPATAITWYFENVEQGIIIEDDAVAHPDFFEYAEMLLERYKSDESVMAIGSMNVDKQKWGNGSYYFSMMNRNLCAWATWKRAWTLSDLRMSSVSIRELAKTLRKYEFGLCEREYWCDRLREVHKDGAGNASWDMQFFMSIWLRHGKGIIPNVNLSSNIGTAGDATHSMESGNIIDNVPSSPILPLVHPDTEAIQHEADRQFHFRYFEPGKANWGNKEVLYYLVNKRIKRLVGHEGPWLKKK